MKITKANVIQRSERELFDGILAELDWNAIEQIFKKRHNLEIQDDVEYKNGDIVVMENQVAYRFDFEVKLNLSVFLNRSGESLDIRTGQNDTDTPAAPDERLSPSEPEAARPAKEEGVLEADPPEADTARSVAADGPAEETRPEANIESMIMEINGA